MRIKKRSLNEDYTNSTEQMNSLLKKEQKNKKKQDKSADENAKFAIDILGKITYNKYVKKGIFAPMPLSALKLEFETFYKLNPENKNIRMLDENDIENVEKLIKKINKLYDKTIFKIRDNGYKHVIQTDITLKTFDDVINMFRIIQKAYKAVFNDDNINWQPLAIKFRRYLN